MATYEIGRAEPTMTERAASSRATPDAADHLQALERRSELLMQEYERNQRTLAESLDATAEVRGTGDAEDGAVTVVLAADHQLIDLELDPRALRLGSISALQQAIKDAFADASDDVRRQLHEAGNVGEEADPVRSFLARMPEIDALLPDGLTDRLLADPPPAEEKPSRASANPGFWKESNPYE